MTMNELMPVLTETCPGVDFASTELIDAKLLDSFDIISLIAAFNDEFDIAVPAEEIIPENFNSAAALLEMLIRLSDE